LTSDRFTGNSAQYGGTLYLGSRSGDYLLTQERFDGNAASVNGGAIDWENGTLSSSSSSFTNNSAEQNGGALIDNADGPALSLVNTTISDNTATFGGGVY